MILALKGIVGIICRVRDVSGLEARSTEVRRDIEVNCVNRTGA